MEVPDNHPGCYAPLPSYSETHHPSYPHPPVSTNQLPKATMVLVVVVCSSCVQSTISVRLGSNDCREVTRRKSKSGTVVKHQRTLVVLKPHQM